jgi:uncharacterized protein with HEPN domain
MQPKDKGLIWDIKTAANEIEIFLKDISYNDFINDKKTRYAIERQLLVIGEAANHISDELKIEYSQIQWKRMIGLRNVLAHEYGEILIDRIWNICKSSIPELLLLIEQVKI